MTVRDEINTGDVLNSTPIGESNGNGVQVQDDGQASGDEDKRENKDKEGKKGGKNKQNSKHGKNAKKRENNEESEANKVIPKKKSLKKSYAEVSREGARMCEIRREGGSSMLQQDYDFAIIKLMYALMEYQNSKKVKDANAWRIIGSGLSRNAVWLGVGSDACVEFLRRHVPEIVEGEDGPQLYLFFGPGERPFRSLRWRVPYMWCRIPVRDLQEMVRVCNPELWIEIERSNGSFTAPIWNIKKRVHDSRDVDPEDGTGFVTFMIEVEEDLMRTLVEQCLGVLKIGATEGRLTGSGMVAEVRAFLGMNDEKDDEGEETAKNDDDKTEDMEMNNDDKTDDVEMDNDDKTDNDKTDDGKTDDDKTDDDKTK